VGERLAGAIGGRADRDACGGSSYGCARSFVRRCGTDAASRHVEGVPPARDLLRVTGLKKTASHDMRDLPRALFVTALARGHVKESHQGSVLPASPLCCHSKKAALVASDLTASFCGPGRGHVAYFSYAVSTDATHAPRMIEATTAHIESVTYTRGFLRRSP